MTDMGSFRIDVEVENPARPGKRGLVSAALVVVARRFATRALPNDR
jgi:hypothetical protein